LAALAGGCGGPSKWNYYTLQQPLAYASTASLRGGSEPAVLIGGLSLPDAVDREDLVVRNGENELVISDRHRWAGLLRSEIADVLASQIARLWPNAEVSTQQRKSVASPDVRIDLDILRFDTVLAQTATVEAAWTVLWIAGKSVTRGRSAVTERVHGPSYQDAVSAHARALDRIGRDITQAIRAHMKL
jgi:hypothetical protein